VPDDVPDRGSGPPDPSLARDLGIAGRFCRIYAYRADGSVLVLDAFERVRRQHKTIQAAYTIRWQKMAEQGPASLKHHEYDRWTGEDRTRHLSAFKHIASKTRVPCFYDGVGVLIVTHLIEGKKEDKLDQRHVLQTLGYCDDYFRRKAEITQQRMRQATRRG